MILKSKMGELKSYKIIERQQLEPQIWCIFKDRKKKMSHLYSILFKEKRYHHICCVPWH